MILIFDFNSKFKVLQNTKVPKPENKVLNPENKVLSPENKVLNPENKVLNPENKVPKAENKVLHDILQMCYIRNCKVQNRKQK